MTMLRLCMFTTVLAACAIAGCSGSTTPGNDAANAGDTGASTADSGADAASAVDAGGTIDTGTPLDTGALVDTGACTPPSDLTAIGRDCRSGGACPSGYVCQSASGAVLQQTCEIPCEPGGCPCPGATACIMHTDKTAMPWYQCDPQR